MSDIGVLITYIMELEEEVPPITLAGMANRPSILPPLPSAETTPAEEPAEEPQPEPEEVPEPVP